MDNAELAKAYQWNYRPQCPKRPSWFSHWPGGNRIAATFNIMHEWESVPRSKAIHKREMTSGAPRIDFLALCAREYGANFGFTRLLDLLDHQEITATVLTSGLMAELFPDTLKEAARRGHEIACHHWDQSRHPFEYSSMEEERDAIARSVDAIEKATGERPVGYMSPGPRPSPVITATPTHPTRSMLTAKNSSPSDTSDRPIPITISRLLASPALFNNLKMNSTPTTKKAQFIR
jgi:hypothetical protein